MGGVRLHVDLVPGSLRGKLSSGVFVKRSYPAVAWRAAAVVFAVVSGVQCSLLADFDGLASPPLADAALPEADTAAPEEDGGALEDASAPDGADGGTPADAGPSYFAVVMEDGPVAYWRLGEADGPVAKDEGAGGHHGVYRGGVAFGAPGALADDPDTAATFGDAKDRVEVTLPAGFDFAGRAPFTVEIWMRRATAGDGSALSKSILDDAGVYRGWFLVWQPTGDLIQFRRGEDTVSAPWPVRGEYFHVVVTYDGYRLILFLDGEEVVGRDTARELAATGAPLLIGKAERWGDFVGELDEVAVYDRALPRARIRRHYEIGAGTDGASAP